MVCCQQTLNRYGNKRFQTFATGFLDENRLHTVVSDMHAELLNSVMPKKGGSIVRTFARTADDKQLEISGSLMRKSHSSISIFVSKIR